MISMSLPAWVARCSCGRVERQVEIVDALSGLDVDEEEVR